MCKTLFCGYTQNTQAPNVKNWTLLNSNPNIASQVIYWSFKLFAICKPKYKTKNENAMDLLNINYDD